jgi:hypothetical protein
MGEQNSQIKSDICRYFDQMMPLDFSRRGIGKSADIHTLDKIALRE